MTWYKNVTWDDAPHLSETDKARVLESYPDYERDTRTKGIPMLGSGAVYPIRDEDIRIDAFKLQPHWAHIIGIDFGISHPFAAVWICWGRSKDDDIMYVYDIYRTEGQTPVYHSHALKRHGDIPVAWPHDGLQRDKGSGIQLKDQYRKHGVTMLPESARYSDDKGGPQSREPAVMEINERMRVGTFKVLTNCRQWFEEKRMYHRKDGKINPINDDLMAATEYAVMMKRKMRQKIAVNTDLRIKYTKPILGG